MPRRPMRIGSVLAAGAVALLTSGCSLSSASPAAAPPAPGTGDRAQIQRLVAGYTSDYVRGDGQAACAAYTPAFRQSAEQRARAGGWTGCAQVLRTLGPQLLTVVPRDERARALAVVSDPSSVVVELRGERASAGFDPRRAGRLSQRVALERVDGQWRISALGVRSGGGP